MRRETQSVSAQQNHVFGTGDVPELPPPEQALARTSAPSTANFAARAASIVASEKSIAKLQISAVGVHGSIVKEQPAKR